MKRNFTSSAVLAALLALPAVAQAEPKEGLYISYKLGVGRLADQDVNHVGTPFGRQPGGYIAAKSSYGFSGAIGYSFSNSLRAEFELDYRRAGFKRTTAGALKDVDSSGAEHYRAAFVNLYYDFHDMSPQTGLTPYIGGGVGIAQIEWDNVQAWKPGERVRMNDKETSKAVQLMAGLSYEMASLPNTVLTAEVRHTRLLDKLSLDGRVVESRFGSFPVTLETENNRRTELLIGFRHSF